MSHYRIRREGMEFPVAGLEALVRLVQEGTLGPNDRVWDPATESWITAAQLGLLSNAFADRAREQAARRNRRKRPRKPLMSGAELGPAPPTTAPSAPEASLFEIPPDLEAHSAELPDATPNASDPGGDQRAVIDGGNLRASGSPNLADAGRATDPGIRPRERNKGRRGGELIAFPDDADGGPRLAELPPFGASLDPEQARAALDNPAAFLRSADSPAQPKPRPPIRPALLLMTVVVGLLGAFLLVSYIQHTNNMYNARLTSPSGPTPQPPPREFGVGEVMPDPEQADADVEGPGPADIYEDMEIELRTRMVPGCSTITREDDLDTALRVELSRLGVQAYSVHAPVLTWGGRKGDVPHGVEIKIWYEGQPGELDRELGSIGLVVGKYAQQYSLDVRAFDVYLRDREGRSRERSLDPAAARQFYLRRISLLQFLTGEGS
jgi:hypothetical protein